MLVLVRLYCISKLLGSWKCSLNNSWEHCLRVIRVKHNPLACPQAAEAAPREQSVPADKDGGEQSWEEVESKIEIETLVNVVV